MKGMMFATLNSFSIWFMTFSMLLVSFLNGAHATESNIDPFKLYPKNIKFDVFRNNVLVGHHKVSFFDKNETDFRVIAEMNLKVRFLTIPVYSYYYRSEASWQKNKLTTLVAEQNDDGKQSRVQAKWAENQLQIYGPLGEVRSNSILFPTNHWHAGVLSQKQVLNTLTGKASNVMIDQMGKAEILAAGTMKSANRYVYSGDIDTTVWYDDAGRWLKMQFKAKDGSLIDYRCVECGLTQLEMNNG